MTKTQVGGNGGGDKNAPKTKVEASEMITKLLADNN